MTWPSVVRRTSMDAGPPKLRRFISHAAEYVDVELKLSRTLLDLLREFIYDTIAGGAHPFEWKDHRTGEACEYRLVDVAQVRPRASRLADGRELWVVAFQLELMPAVVTQTLTANNRPPPFRSNFGSGFGGMHGGIFDDGGDFDVDGAFLHELVPGSSDQGAPGGPGTGLPPGTDPCSGGSHESSSSSSSGCG